MLQGDNVARLRCELGTDLASPRNVFEDFSLLRSLLNRRDVFPSPPVAQAVA